MGDEQPSESATSSSMDPTRTRTITMGSQESGPRKTHKRKVIFSGNGVRRFTGGSRPQGHLPRLISHGFGPERKTIRDPREIPLCAIPLCAFLAPINSEQREGPRVVPHPVSYKNKVAARPRGARGRPREADLGPPGPPKTPKNHRKSNQKSNQIPFLGLGT